MKQIIIILLLLWSMPLIAQQASIITESDSIQAKIQANTYNSILTTKGTFLFDDIIRINFHSKPSESLLNTIKEAGIAYVYQEVEFDEISSKPTQSIMVVNQNDLSVDIGNFNKTRRASKQTQLLGMIVSGIGLAAKEDKVVIGGSILFFAGLIGDVMASDHLKKYERR